MSWLARKLGKCSLFRLHQPSLGSNIFPAESMAGRTVHYRIMVLKKSDEKHEHKILNSSWEMLY